MEPALTPRMSARASLAVRRNHQAKPPKRKGRNGGITEEEIKDVEELATPRTPVIYEVVRRLGEEEMERPFTSLWWSGVAAGLSISFSLLSQAIEIRGAPFAGWITDLSLHDPLYITPLLMGVTMLWQQRLQPGTGDPVQQKVLMFMPVMFTVMFLWAPSGLVVYWFVSNLWAIGQQYFTNWLIGPAKVPAAAGGKR